MRHVGKVDLPLREVLELFVVFFVHVCTFKCLFLVLYSKGINETDR